MITTISKQGGRRYPQSSGSTLSAQYLPSIGSGGSAPVATTVPGSRYRWGFRHTWAHLLWWAVLLLGR